MNLGTRIFGLGIMALGAVCLATAELVIGHPLPDDFPHRAAIGYAGGAVLLACGAGLQWRRTIAWSAGALATLHAVIVLLLIDLTSIAANATEFGSYSNTAEDAAITAAALIVVATHANIGATLSARLIRLGQTTFGLCAVLFGGAHFVYLNLTIPYVPKFLPPSRLFWAYATGIFHIAGGLAILSGVRARLAAILLTILYASFTPLVHLPMPAADPHNHFIWSENALNLALAGAAWVVAASLRGRMTA